MIFRVKRDLSHAVCVLIIVALRNNVKQGQFQIKRENLLI